MAKDPKALKAELKLLEAEAAFVKKKATKKGVTRNDKLALRALRYEYRTKWRKTPEAPAGGAQPDTAGTTATVQEPG